MPRTIVTIQPPGSFPGMRNFAIAPAIKPKMIHVMIFICVLYSELLGRPISAPDMGVEISLLLLVACPVLPIILPPGSSHNWQM